MTLESDRMRRTIHEQFRAWKGEMRDFTAQIVEAREFSAGKKQLAESLKQCPVRDFDTVLDLAIGGDVEEFQKAIDTAFNAAAHEFKTIDQLTGIGFELSEHAMYRGPDGEPVQGVELYLYNRNIFDFLATSDEDFLRESRSSRTAWEGDFDIQENATVTGMHGMLRLSAKLVREDHHSYGYTVTEAGTDRETVSRNPLAWTEIVANAMTALEFHRFMHSLIPRLKVPHDMVAVIGNHDLPHVPTTHYRLNGYAQGWKLEPGPSSDVIKSKEEALRSIANVVKDGRMLEHRASPFAKPKAVFGRRIAKP